MAKRRRVRATSTMPTPAAQDRQWRAEADMRTLEDAGTIMGDPPRLRAARRMAVKKMAGLRRVAGRSLRRS